MKSRYICLVLALASTIQSGAQNIYDAMTLSESQYYGTARSMSLGNAVTALGGDLGMIGINPAGGAVAGYSQIAVTPGLSVSAVTSSYCPSYGGTFDAAQKSSLARAVLPNAGINIRFDRSIAGLRNINLTVTANATDFYTSNMDNTGINSQTSKFAEFAAAANGILPVYMDYSYQPDMWDVVNAYESGTVALISADGYMGSSEYLSADGSYHYIPGELSQRNSFSRYGHKTDIVIGLSGNIDDCFYVGLNLGLPSVRSSHTQSYTETALDPKQFPAVFENLLTEEETTTYYNSGLYEYNFASLGNGVYGKLGLLYVPSQSVRMGVAISTPVSYTMEERWQYSGSVKYLDSYYSVGRTSSPTATTAYSFRGSWEINAGLALVAGERGLLSVDYEMTDYSHMGYRGSVYDVVNELISEYCGQSHNVRAGLEVRVTDAVSVRGGWTMLTCPEKCFDDIGNGRYYKRNTYSYALGAGYNGPAGLFVDIAAKMTAYPSSEYYPYYDYVNYDKSGNQVNVQSPVISWSRKLWNIALTLGWRF